MASIDIDKVRIIVIGDSGVGKTSLIHTLCHGEPINNPSWTIGCSVDVKLHEYREGTAQQKTYFVELWDVGGSSGHKNTRSVFFTPAHGIILVHDLTNRKSEVNLRKWLAEVLTKECNATSSGRNHTNTRNVDIDEYDPEQFIGSSQIPILVVGTKLDLAEEVRAHFNRRPSPIAEECGAGEIFVDCTTSKAMAPGSSSSVKLSRFFDLVIEKRFYNRDRPSPFTDKRTRLIPGYSGTTINHKTFHFE